MYLDHTMAFFAYFIENGVNFNNVITAFSLEVNFVLQIFFLFFMVFIKLVLVNTILYQFVLLKNKIIKKYNNPFILVKRGYNGSLRSLIRLAIPGAVFGYSLEISA